MDSLPAGAADALRVTGEAGRHRPEVAAENHPVAGDIPREGADSRQEAVVDSSCVLFYRYVRTMNRISTVNVRLCRVICPKGQGKLWIRDNLRRAEHPRASRQIS